MWKKIYLGPKMIVRQRGCLHSYGESQAPKSSSSPMHHSTYFCLLLYCYFLPFTILLNHLPPHPRIYVQAPLRPTVFA